MSARALNPQENERAKEYAKRIAELIAEPGAEGFEVWGSALAITIVSMAQFTGTPKATFLSGLSKNWDAWAKSMDDDAEAARNPQ